MRVAALLLLLGAGALPSACGSGGGESPAALRLRREDLIAVAGALRQLEGAVGAEVAAAKAAWPSVAHGLPSGADQRSRALIAAAASSAAAIGLPPALREAQARSLTGPAAQIAGLVRSYALLCARGWKLISAAQEQITRGTAAAARFARANVPLYIESVYDGHFTLAQIGKKLRTGYDKLGGPGAFGAALGRSAVNELSAYYSEASDRLHPHVGVRLGS